MIKKGVTVQSLRHWQACPLGLEASMLGALQCDQFAQTRAQMQGQDQYQHSLVKNGVAKMGHGLE